jgi:predicted dehydrogenase
VAQALLNAGADVFVEKPLAASLDGVDELIASSQRTKRILQVGYNLRFHPVLTLVKRLLEDKAIGPVLYAHARVGQYLPDWRPQVDYRQSYTARRDLGGGILLDASHELDYVLWLLGNPVSVACVAGKASSLDVDVEDSATVLLGYARGAHAVVHMDFVRRGYARTLELVGETGNLVADLGQRSLRLERSRDEARDIEVPEGDMYVAELGHFLECVATRMPPLVDAAAGRQTLRLVMLAKIAARDGSTHQVG